MAWIFFPTVAELFSITSSTLHRRQFHKKMASGPWVWVAHLIEVSGGASRLEMLIFLSLWYGFNLRLWTAKSTVPNKGRNTGKWVLEKHEWTIVSAAINYLSRKRGGGCGGGRRLGQNMDHRRKNSETARYRYIAVIKLFWCHSHSRLWIHYTVWFY